MRFYSAKRGSQFLQSCASIAGCGGPPPGGEALAVLGARNLTRHPVTSRVIVNNHDADL
ncbi:hypothetical protein MACH26_21230 [Planctobacterium marinum]|uniref:Uncharacterized protein n=1 Tax=Planctobacterium marinum TaxID=1631968 RepID=A0AA48KRY7_9ALTE|nr:hypothetical protein MACH26_21230 [Planctobacterium marinum]